MLCSKLNCQIIFKLEDISYKIANKRSMQGSKEESTVPLSVACPRYHLVYCSHAWRCVSQKSMNLATSSPRDGTFK